jgi:hypothetical protein
MTSLLKFSSGIILVALLGSMILSLLHLSHGMGMVGSMTDCPFMNHGEVLCPMDMASHIGAWKEVFNQFPLSQPVWFGVILAAIPFLARIVANNWWRLCSRSWLLPKKHYRHDERFWQQFFAVGILNPKLF